MNTLLKLEKQGDAADPVAFTKEKLARKEKIMGFGHRVYKTFDPRAYHLRKMSKSLSEETGHTKLYEWSEAMVKTMKEEKNIDPNVDFFSATVASAGQAAAGWGRLSAPPWASRAVGPSNSGRRGEPAPPLPAKAPTPSVTASGSIPK